MSTSSECTDQPASLQEHIPEPRSSQPELAPADCPSVVSLPAAVDDRILTSATAHVSTALLNSVVAELAEELSINEFLDVLADATAPSVQGDTSVVLEHLPGHATIRPRGGALLEQMAPDEHPNPSSSFFAAPFHINQAGSRLPMCE